MFKYILNRLTERSTWLGLLVVATACGATIEEALADQIITAGMAVTGLIGIVTKDQKKKRKVRIMSDNIASLQKEPCYWQRLLRLAGYYNGHIDGITGRDTQESASTLGH